MAEDQIRRIVFAGNETETARIAWDAIHGKPAAIFNGSDSAELVVGTVRGPAIPVEPDPELADLYVGIEPQDWTLAAPERPE